MAGFTMTRDEIIRMAQEASILGSFDMLQGNQWRQDTIRDLERFAALVAAAERKAIEPIVYGLCISDNNAREIVTAIRKRGQE